MARKTTSFVERFTGLIEDLSFFKQRLKCKAYSVDKEETSYNKIKDLETHDGHGLLYLMRA